MSMSTSMSVRELMLRDVAVLGPQTSLREAAARMSRSRRGLVVVANGERVQGLVTLRRLVFGATAAAQGHPINGVGDLASRRFVLTWEGEPLEELTSRMVRAGAGRAVVVEDGKVVGVVTTLELAQRARHQHAVDLSSEASFPASDPPSWTGTWAG